MHGATGLSAVASGEGGLLFWLKIGIAMYSPHNTAGNQQPIILLALV
jgi:hypothetical protein